MKEEISIEKKEDKIEIEIEEKEGMEIELEGNEKIKEIINEKYDDTEIKTEIEKIRQENTEQDKKIENKIDKEEGKGLTTNDFTNTYKNKLDSIDELGGYDDTEIKKEIEKLKEENEIIKTQIPKRRSKRRKDRNRRQ